MSFDKKIENFYGFNPNKMNYDISYDKDKICFNSENLIIQKSFLNLNNIIFGESSGNPIKTIKYIKRGKYIITTEINEKENNLIILVYESQDYISLYHKTKIDINEYSSLQIKKVFFDINSNLKFIISLLNENNEILIFKGKLEKDSLSIFCDYFCNINNFEISIKLIKYIFEYNLLICSSKEKIISIKINEKNNENEINDFEVMDQISYNSFEFIPKSMTILNDNIEIKNNLIEEKKQIKIIILSKNGKCNIYSTKLNLLKEISLNTIENNYNLDDEEENYDLIYNYSYLSTSEGIIILGSDDSKIYIYDSIFYNQKYTINISELNDKLIMSKVSFVYINEKSDLIYIILFNGQIFSGKLSLILYKKIGSLKLLSYGHKNKIISLDISSYENENNNNAFYTISQNGPLIKTYFNGSKFTNLIYNDEKIKFTTCKINPKYNNLLYAGDDMGNLYIFDIDNRKFELINIEKIANFKIDSISFNNNINNDYFSIGFDSGMITIHDINFQDYKSDFILKVCEDFNYNCNKEKINSFCYFYEDIDDNRICYLSKENVIMIGNLNSINNKIILMNEANYSYNINKFGYILDIKIHPSKKYLFILLSTHQIDIRDLDNINVRIGVIDLFQFKKVNKIDFDISGDFMIYSNYDNLYIYNLRKNKVYKEINKLFNMTFCKFTNDGRYFILCGNNGSICIMLNFNDIKNFIYNYKDDEIKYGINKIRERFILKFDEHLLKERNINKKKIIHPHEENKEQKIEKIKHSNTQQYFIDNNNFNFIQKNNLQKIHIMDDYKKTKDNFFNQNNAQNLYMSQNYQNQNILLDQDYTYSNHNNLIQSQRIPQQNLNYNNSNQFIQSQRNLNYNNSNQFIQSQKIPQNNLNIDINNSNNLIKTFKSQRIYPNSNYITLNKDPSIFPINQKSTIEKINKNYYINSNNMLYPTITSDIVEKNSKQNQNNIRKKNISNAIFEISKPNIQKESYQLIKNHNQENFKKQNLVYPQNDKQFKNIPKDSFNQNYNINNEQSIKINQINSFKKKEQINNFNQNYNISNGNFNILNNTNNNENKQNNDNNNQNLTIKKNYTQNYKIDLEKFENNSYYSNLTNNGSYYINNGIDNKKRKILPDDDSIDNIIEVNNNSFENNNIEKKKSKINESFPNENNSIKNKSFNSNSIKNEKNKEGEKRNNISQFNKSNNDFSIHSFSKKDNNSAFDDIDNVEKDIKRFEIQNKNFIK